MRILFLTCLLVFGTKCFVTAQSRLDSLKQQLKITKDASRVNVLRDLADAYVSLDPELALSYATDGIELAIQIQSESDEYACIHQKARALYKLGKYKKAVSVIENVIAYYQKEKAQKQVSLSLKLLGNCKERQGKYDEALMIQREGLEAAQSVNFEKGIAAALNNIAIVYMRKADYAASIATYEQAILLYKKIKDDESIANTYRNIGIVYKRKGDYDLALDYYYKSLKINEKNQNPRRLAKNWNSIGTIFIELNQIDKSKAAFLKASSFLDQKHPSRLHYNILNNLGSLYSAHDKLDSALIFYEKSLLVSNELESFIKEGVSLHNIGAIHFEKGDYTKALAYFEKALKANPDAPDLENNVRVWIKMGMVYLDLEDYSKSITFLEKGLDHAKQLGLKKLKSLALEYLVEVHKKLNEPQKALDYQEQYILIKDSLFNQEKAAQVQSLILAHEETQNQQKIISLEQETMVQKLTQQRLWISILAIALIGLLLFIIQYKRAQYARKQQQLLSIQKNWLELQSLRNQFKPHFVFNALVSIQNFLIIKDTEKALLYISEFAQLMREMLENTDKDTIILEDEINFLKRYLKIEQIRTNHHFDFEIIKGKDLDDSEIFVPNLLLQTITENAIWHGVMPKKEKGHISLRFKKEKEWLIMEVEDNGVGRYFHKKENHFSKGLNLLQQRIDALNKKEDLNIRWHIEDLKSGKGVASGTKVSIEYLVDVN